MFSKQQGGGGLVLLGNMSNHHIYIYIYKFNPIRSSEVMLELSKKRWVSHICTVVNILMYPPKPTFFVWFQLCIKSFLFDIPAYKSPQKQRSGRLLGPTTGGGLSGQRFSIKDTPLKLLITTEKLGQ